MEDGDAVSERDHAVWLAESMVFVLFVINGSILGVKAIDYEEILDVFLAAMRKYLELMVPVGAAVGTSYVFLMNGAYEDMGSVYLISGAESFQQSVYQNRSLTPRDALMSTFVWTFCDPARAMPMPSSVLWIIPFLFLGSILVLFLCMLVNPQGPVRTNWRWVLYCGMIVYLWTLSPSPKDGLDYSKFYLPFVYGLCLSDARTFFSGSGCIRAVVCAVSVFIVVFAKRNSSILILVGFPHDQFHLLDGLGALILVASVCSCDVLQRFFASPPFLCLGRLSLSVYLVHGIILDSLGVFVFIRLQDALSTSHSCAGCLAIVSTVLVSYATAVPFQVFQSVGLSLGELLCSCTCLVGHKLDEEKLFLYPSFADDEHHPFPQKLVDEREDWFCQPLSCESPTACPGCYTPPAVPYDEDDDENARYYNQRILREEQQQHSPGSSSPRGRAGAERGRQWW
jgi:hypothetical protein